MKQWKDVCNAHEPERGETFLSAVSKPTACAGRPCTSSRKVPTWCCKCAAAGDSKCNSVAWGSKCEFNCSIVKHRVQNGITKHVTQNAIQTLNMLTAPLSLLLSDELNHSIVRHRVQNGSIKHVIQNAIRWHGVQKAINSLNSEAQGSKWQYKACDSKLPFGGMGFKM
jgi:hypothetical protein